MADKVYELVSWPANEEYLNNPASFSERTFRHAVNEKGVQILFHGPEVNASRLGAVVGQYQYMTPSYLPATSWLTRDATHPAWDTLEDFKTLNANATGRHTKLREYFALTRSTPGLTGIHKVMATFTADPFPTVQVPVTEILFAALKPGADLQSLTKSVGKAVAGSNSPASPALAAVQGSLIDDPETVVLLIGWNSYEDYINTSERGAKAIVEEIGSQATLDAHFYSMIQVGVLGDVITTAWLSVH
ncbi:hypothetical protein BC826DRAFT_966724 [Russula brevipes]|nr:hypothetical protein BC826DRAFT_966724 [Russula brevipes]